MISFMTQSKRRRMEDTIITLRHALQAVIAQRNLTLQAHNYVDMRIDRLLLQIKEWRGRHQLSGNAEHVLNHINTQLLDIHDRVVDVLRSMAIPDPTATPDAVGHQEGGAQ